MKFGLLTSCTRVEDHCCIESSAVDVPLKNATIQGEKLEELRKMMLQWTEETKLLNHQLRSNPENNDDLSTLSGASTKGTPTTVSLSQLHNDSFDDINTSTTTPQTNSSHDPVHCGNSENTSVTVVSNLPEIALAEEISKMRKGVHAILAKNEDLTAKVKTLQLGKSARKRNISNRKRLEREPGSLTQTRTKAIPSNKDKRSVECLNRQERARLRRTQAQSKLEASMSVLNKYKENPGDRNKELASNVEGMSSALGCSEKSLYLESPQHAKELDMAEKELKAMKSQIQKLEQEKTKLIVRLRNHEAKEAAAATEAQNELETLKHKFAEKTSIREAHIAELEEENELIGARLKMLESMVQTWEEQHQNGKPAILSRVPALWNRIQHGTANSELKPSCTTTAHIVTI